MSAFERMTPPFDSNSPARHKELEALQVTNTRNLKQRASYPSRVPWSGKLDLTARNPIDSESPTV